MGPVTRARHRRRSAALGLSFSLVLLAGCANVSAQTPTYSPQPSLTPAEVTPVVPTPALPGVTPSVSSPSGSPSPSSTPQSSKPADPCVPADPAVIAACLSAPWGLVPLADGTSALVGERTTGRILKAVYQQKPVVVTTIPNVVSAGDGGLLGLAISPTYAEDGLIYAYVTTATDNRILRIAPNDKPKVLFSGIPKGSTHNGGPITFVGNYLYVATGDTGQPAVAAQSTSLAGKVLRLDESGHPAGGNLTPGSPVYASGLTQPTGMCALPTGTLGVVDQRTGAALLLSVKAGKSYATPASGDALWTWKSADGGASDCAYDSGELVDTSLPLQRLTGIQLTAQGTFSGNPETLLDKTYGRLLTVESGPQDLFWMTTSNKDGQGKPIASDDRVIVLHNSAAGGGGGID